MNIKAEDIIVVGAGLTGLLLARGLKALGKDCLILEKSRGVGGRIATRRIDDLGFDHGAPYLRDLLTFEDSFKTFFNSKRGYGLSGGMNQLPKLYAQNLRIIKEQKVSLIKREKDLWNIQTDEGLNYHCKCLVITAPVPQACELLDSNNLLPKNSHLRDIIYHKALIYLAVLKSIPEDLTSFGSEGCHFNLMRERNLHPQGLVLELSSAESEKLFHLTDEEIMQYMRSKMSSSPLGKLGVEKDELKKWRYSQVLNTHPSCYEEVAPGLYVTGDGFNGAIQLSNNLVQVLGSLA